MTKPEIRKYERRTESALGGYADLLAVADLVQVRNNLKALGAYIKKCEEQREKIESLGIIDGYVQFKDEKYMVIYSQQKKGKREREYIGADPGDQALAVEAIARYDEWVKIDRLIQALERRCYRIERQLEDLIKNTNYENPLGYNYSF